MSNFKLQFKLKQHTPLIHFQHDQAGATLRATELKPKLDRFILTKLGNGNSEAEKYKNGIEIAGRKGWLIGKGDHPALDYRVKIKGEIEFIKIPEGRRNQYGAFFGTIGREYREDPKGLSFSNKEITLKIIGFKTELLKKIDNCIPLFFEITNFGTRQSKGFGSYTIIKKIEGDKEIPVEYSNKAYKTFFELNLSNNNWFEKYKLASNDIVLLYKAIRSGINLKRNRGKEDKFYFKSLMFLYAKQLGIQWEKKTIKEIFFNNKLKTQQNQRSSSEALHYTSNNKKLMKDLLGLSSLESWFSYNSTIEKKQAKFNNVTNKWEEKPPNKINFERFKSPITFKPVLNGNKLRVYIYLDQNALEFAINVNKDFIIKNNRKHFHIKFPDYFSLNDFFNFFLDHSSFNITTHVEQKFHNQREYSLLKDLFNQMTKNKTN